MFRAVAVLRLVLFANVVFTTAERADFTRPVLGWTLVTLMGVWTSVVSLGCLARPAWRPVLLVIDAIAAVAALALSPVVRGPDFHASLPGFWIMGAVMGLAAQWRFVGGLVGGVLVAAANLLVRSSVDSNDLGNSFLLLIGGPVVGYLTGSLDEMARARDVAEREAAVAAERARLARVVHDGVLQVLALVQRRGPELGSDGAGLAALAGEQEIALRRLIHAQARPVGGTTDLAAALTALETSTVSVSVPASPVELPAELVGELVAAVAECLANVARHVGADAPAWVLLDTDGAGSVVVSVRDEGPGIAEGRLAEAAAAGRLGVAESVIGRMTALGGRAVLDTGPGGTEWELTLPRP